MWRPRSPGRAVIANLKATGFDGPLAVVNPRYPEIEGVRTVPSLMALQQAPDLVVIAAPATETRRGFGASSSTATAIRL